MTNVGPLKWHSMALLTDLYQLTMAQGYWKVGAHHKDAVFHQFFRRSPFDGAYAIACGMQNATELLEEFGFQQDDIDYLATLVGNDGKPLFELGFLDYLANLELELDIDMVREVARAVRRLYALGAITLRAG